MSPVVIAKPTFARLPLPCLTRLLRFALTLRTTWSNTCVPSASWGRHDAPMSPPAASAKSTRAGLISSTTCGSVSCAKSTIERRLAVRPRLAFADPPRRVT